MRNVKEMNYMKTTAKYLIQEATMKGFITVLTIVSLTLVGSTGLISAAGKGTSGGQFLRTGAGARGPGMASAFSPIADDATAIYWNPAGMANMEKKEVVLSYNAYFEDSAGQFVGYGHPTRKGTFGVGVSLFGVQDIDRRSATAGDADAPDLGNFDTSDMAFALAWANKRSLGRGRLNYGLSLKFINSDLETEKAATGAADLGFLYKLKEEGRLTFSLAVLNLGGELKFKDEGDPLPLNVKPGMAYQINFERMGKLSAVLDSDMLVNDGVAYVQPGFEWTPLAAFTLRSGYQFGRDEEAGSGFAAGVGFRLMSIGIDYAFVPFGDLGDTHRMSLGYRF